MEMKLFSLQFYLLLFVFTEQASGVLTSQDGNNTHPYLPSAMLTGYIPIQQKVNCTRACGNMSVPFPFGLEDGCSANKLLQLKCANSMSTLQFDEEHQVTYIDINNSIVDISYTPQQMFRVDAPKEPSLYIGSLVSSSVQWVFANLTCQAAQKNSSGYGCVSRNSRCLAVNSTAGYIGYRCKCLPGFEGNPYVRNGCLGSCSVSLHLTILTQRFIALWRVFITETADSDRAILPPSV